MDATQIKVALGLLVAAFLWPKPEGDVPGEITQTATICADVLGTTCNFGDPISLDDTETGHQKLQRLIDESNAAIAADDVVNGGT